MIDRARERRVVVTERGAAERLQEATISRTEVDLQAANPHEITGASGAPLEECRELVARLHEPGGQALDEQELRDALVSALERPTTQSQLRVGVRRLL